MLKIEFDPSTLSKAQREDLAGFILGWDASSVLTVTEPTTGTLAPNAAPSSADADLLRIAPVDTTVNTSSGNAPPPPVPQPALPGNTAAPQSPNLAEVDSKGMPWDERIHSSSKAKVAGGTWKYKRGVSEDEIKRVENELYSPSLSELFTAPIVRPTVQVIPSTDTTNVLTAPPPPGTDTTDIKAGEVVFQNTDGTISPQVDLRKEFAQLMIRVANAKGTGKITAEEVTAALAEYNVQSLPMLSMKLGQVPAVAAAIDALIASRG